MSLSSYFDSIAANSVQAQKYYHLGRYAEAAQLCDQIDEHNRFCLEQLRQAAEAQNQEVCLTWKQFLMSQTQAVSGDSSIEDSMNETTPPQNFTGVSPASLKRKPSDTRPQSTRKSSRASSPPTQRQLAPVKTQSTTPPQFYQAEFTTPHPQANLARPQTIVPSQSLPHDLHILPSQGTPFMTPQVPQSAYGGYPNPVYPGFRSQPGTPYFAPTNLRYQPNPYQPPTLDFSQHQQFQVATNPMNLIDPTRMKSEVNLNLQYRLKSESNPGLQFRRPSEPIIPTHTQLSQPSAPTPATPTINLPGTIVSFPAPPPPNQSGGETPFPPNLLPELDQRFVDFLQRVLSDESMTDTRGEPLHHPLPPRKQQKLHALPLTSWRPIKLRIQAFTSAFQEELVRTLAANLARHEVSIKRVREYLWTKDLIARYNPSGRKAKSRGSHVWCLEARRRADSPHAEWEFRAWKRKMQLMKDSLVIVWGQLARLPLKVWDPQVPFEDLEVKFQVRGQLPNWLSWEGPNSLTGIPPKPENEESYKVSIPLTAEYTAFGMKHVIEARLDLDIRSPGSSMGDLSSSLRSTSTAQAGATAGNVTGGMEPYLDDDEDDDMMFSGNPNPFSSGNNSPPSANITPTTANPNQLLYVVPSQSLSSSPMKQSPAVSTSSAGGMPNVAMHPLTPSLSPTSLQFNPAIISSIPHHPSSAPQTPIGGPPSHLSLQITTQSHEASTSAPPTQGHFRYVSDVQPTMVYGVQSHMRHSPPLSTESAGGGNRMYTMDEDLTDNISAEQGYFDDSYPLELGSPFLER